MKTIIQLISVILIFAFFHHPTFAQTSGIDKVIGNWSGKIELPNAKLEVIFKISAEGGNLASTMDVPMQGAKDLKVNKTTATSDFLILEIASINGKFEGKFETDSTISGTWEQGGMNFPLSLKKSVMVSKLQRPQTPQPPFSYLSENVEYINTKSKLKIAGTLTIPKNAVSCPAVILISGSGAQDRDETIFEHKPFLVIADYLTRNGIAVLRVDDRGVGGSEGNISSATSEDFAGDVLAGIEFLKTRSEINHSKIGLIGHSEGGIIAPMAANQSDNVAFIILLAGPGISGEQIMYKQNDLVLKAAGMNEDVINQNRKLQEAIFNILLNEKDSAIQTDRLQRTYSGGMYQAMNYEQKKAIDDQINAINNKWFRFFLTYDPYPTLTKVKCPVLALNGEKDLQVPAKQNLEVIEKALNEGGNKNFNTMEISNLNHLFQNCKTGAVSEYGEIEETFAPNVLAIINDWIWKTIK
jgi:uncharacterized protein